MSSVVSSIARAGESELGDTSLLPLMSQFWDPPSCKPHATSPQAGRCSSDPSPSTKATFSATSPRRQQRFPEGKQRQGRRYLPGSHLLKPAAEPGCRAVSGSPMSALGVPVATLPSRPPYLIIES